MEYMEDIQFTTMKTDSVFSVLTKINKRLTNSNFKIVFTIKAPENINLTLNDRFGEVFIESITGKASIDIAHGSLRLNNLPSTIRNNPNELNILFSNAIINNAGNIALGTKSSQIKILNSTIVAIASSHSNIELAENTVLFIDSKFDTYEIGNTVSMNLKCDFSTIEAGSIGKKLVIDMKYGDLQAGRIKNEFKNIEISNKYGNIELNIDKDASYNLEAEIEEGEINYDNIPDIQKKKSEETLYLKGIVGNNTKTRSLIKIYCKYGAVKLY
jgi:hypothetical protein